MTLYARHRCKEQTFGLWEKARVEWFERIVLRHVYYHMWNRSPVQVGCMRQGAQGWCTGMTLRDGMGREFRMGNTCKPMADSCQFSSVQSLSRVRLFAIPWIAALQTSLSITNSQSSLTLSPWCHPAISSSVVPFSSCPQSLPASESFPMSQLFAWGGQSTGASALASFRPKKSQGWSPSEWTSWILQSKGPSRVFSNTTVQKHQFFGAQPSSQSNSHIHTWPQEKP